MVVQYTGKSKRSLPNDAVPPSPEQQQIDGPVSVMEVLRFFNPKFEGERTLFVAGFPAELSKEKRRLVVEKAFSQFGLLYQICLPISETLPYAFVTFYSLLSATRAKAVLNQVLCVDGKTLKVGSILIHTSESI